jgi:hypothetical protein
MARSAYKRGQIAWLVCGWKEPPLNEDGESDWDKTSDFQYVCHSRESAEAKAKQLAPTTAHGYCTIQEARRDYEDEFDEDDGLLSWIPIGQEIEVHVEEAV